MADPNLPLFIFYCLVRTFLIQCINSVAPFLFKCNRCYINLNGGENHLQPARVSGIRCVCVFLKLKPRGLVVLIVLLSEHISQHVPLYSSVTLFPHSSPCPVLSTDFTLTQSPLPFSLPSLCLQSFLTLRSHTLPRLTSV